MRVCTLIVHARPLVLGVAHALRTPLKLLQLRAHSTDVVATVAFRTSRSRCPSRGRKQVSEIEKKGRTGADGTAKEITKVLPGDCSVPHRMRFTGLGVFAFCVRLVGHACLHYWRLLPNLAWSLRITTICEHRTPPVRAVAVHVRRALVVVHGLKT